MLNLGKRVIGQFFSATWSFLERRVGRTHIVSNAQLKSLRKANQMRPHDPASLIQFLVIVSDWVSVLNEYKQIDGLQSSSALYMTADRLPLILKEKWWFYVDDKNEDWPDRIMFKKSIRATRSFRF